LGVKTVRILHTSDWHLGKSFQNEIELIDDQRRFGAWLVELVQQRSIDVVVIAGDLFQRAEPSQAAWTLYWEILRDLDAVGCKVVGISGNHDSSERVGGPEPLLTRLGITLRGDMERLAEPVVIPDEHGPVEFYPLPYLQPYHAGHVLGLPDGSRSHEAVLGEAISRVRSRAHDGRTVLVAHAFVRDGKTSESELELVGGESQVPASLFEGFTYVALGHLHTFQTCGSETICYSGSPLPYSFSETADKQVVLVELDANGISSIEPIRCDVGRQSKILQGTLEDLLDNPDYAKFEDRFILARITDPDRIFDAKARLEQRFPHLVRLEWVGLRQIEHQRVKARSSAAERVTDFLAASLGEDCSEEHRRIVLDELVAVQSEMGNN
jgi:exonuclease SbcD